MTATLGGYTLGKTLGSGFSAKVKLATAQDGSQYAMKIFRLDNPNFSQRAFQLLRDEVQSVSNMDHKHVVKYFEFNESAVMTKKNGEQVPVAYLTQELVPGGELFDYVANSGPFSEAIVRYYAKQLIQSIHYIHTKGFAHRDLKCENILLDKLYDIKVVDFGFACPVEGRNGNGMNRSYVGSLGFMAPEIHAKQPYQGQVIDLFALGVILFILYAGHPPFESARLDDPHYKLIATNRCQQFWATHQNRKPDGFFTENFKDLVTAMLSFHPHSRLSIPDIVAHPWLQQGDFATAEQVRTEFATREQANKEIARQEAEKKLAMKNHVQSNQAHRDVKLGDKKYRWIASPTLTDAEKNEANTILLNMKEYQAGNCHNHGFFSSLPPEDIFQALTNKMTDDGQEFSVSDTHWKVNWEVQRVLKKPEEEDEDDADGDEEEEEKTEQEQLTESAQVQFEIQTVPDIQSESQPLVFVNFKRKAGAAILFYENAKTYVDTLQLFNNSTAEGLAV